VIAQDAEFPEQKRLDRGDDFAHEPHVRLIGDEVGQGLLGHLAGVHRFALGVGAGLAHRLVSHLGEHVQALHDLEVLLPAEHPLKTVVNADLVEREPSDVSGFEVLEHGIRSIRRRVKKSIHHVTGAQVGDDVGG
jgi:hypothetical protein